MAQKTFRSGLLGLLSAADVQKLRQMELQCVVDFRGSTERLAQTRALRGAKVHALGTEPTIVQALQAHAQQTKS